MNKPLLQKFKTTNWREYNAALKSRGAIDIWFDPQMKWEGSLTGKRGRSPGFSNEAIQLCLTLKCLFQLPLRQTTGLVQSILNQNNLGWVAPDFSTLSPRQKDLKVNIAYRSNTEGLHLLVDSTGIKFMGEGEWKRKKHGAEYRRQWRKVHIGINAKTLEICAIEMTDNSTGDASTLPELLKKIPVNESILSVSGDGAYDTKKCHQAIAKRNAEPIIPTRRNAQIWKGKTTWAKSRNETLILTNQLGRSIWRKWSGYHQRSLVECKMRCFKLLGERLMSKDLNRQITELHVRAAVLNRFTHLGTPTTVRVN